MLFGPALKLLRPGGLKPMGGGGNGGGGLLKAAGIIPGFTGGCVPFRKNGGRNPLLYEFMALSWFNAAKERRTLII